MNQKQRKRRNERLAFYKMEEETKSDETFKKIAFWLGWLSVFNLIFWIAMAYMYADNRTEYKRFINPETKRVVRFFGYLHMIILCFGLVALILYPFGIL